MRQLVDYPTTEKPGTIVVDTKARFIYLVQEGGKALRYGVGVGKEGLEFKGAATMNHKAQWPSWTPTPDMIKREPERYRNGLAAWRAAPTTRSAPAPSTCSRTARTRSTASTAPTSRRPSAQAVSSGCIRMMNQDVIDLYSRVPAGSKVIVL